MKKILLVLALTVIVPVFLTSCTPDRMIDPIEDVQACCENEGTVETPPPLPPPENNSSD